MWRLWLGLGHYLGFAALLFVMLLATTRPTPHAAVVAAALVFTGVVHLIVAEILFDSAADGPPLSSPAGRGRFAELFRVGFIAGAVGAALAGAVVWICATVFNGYYWLGLLVPALSLAGGMAWAVEPKKEAVRDGSRVTPTNGYPRFPN